MSSKPEAVPNTERRSTPAKQVNSIPQLNTGRRSTPAKQLNSIPQLNGALRDLEKLYEEMRVLHTEIIHCVDFAATSPANSKKLEVSN